MLSDFKAVNPKIKKRSPHQKKGGDQNSTEDKTNMFTTKKWGKVIYKPVLYSYLNKKV